VDLIADNWKKYPLLLVGELSGFLPEAQQFSVTTIGAPGPIILNNYYVVVSAEEGERSSVLAQLQSSGLCPAQLIVLLSPESSFSHERQAFIGQLDLIAGESADEFRSRLLGKLEAQRQKMLSYVLQEAADTGIARSLTELELGTTLDSCRIAHALACSYALSPAAHERVLRSCFALTKTPGCSQSADSAVERLIVDASLLLLQCFRDGTSFRDHLKERNASLPFRARNDLLHHVEATLGHLLRGKCHVA